jgi:hypothetical protein
LPWATFACIIGPNPPHSSPYLWVITHTFSVCISFSLRCPTHGHNKQPFVNHTLWIPKENSKTIQGMHVMCESRKICSSIGLEKTNSHPIQWTTFIHQQRRLRNVQLINYGKIAMSRVLVALIPINNCSKPSLLVLIFGSSLTLYLCMIFSIKVSESWT